ncbi:uncharacterized protein METZ01_LOCUS490972 [marine metagenome]|uniref:Carboxymuconolactone decarboxylase-like domain-containing protein n=1 Tax=marine metagenome TaxID=408172 RepID=A0A383D2M4_9ZZZZ
MNPDNLHSIEALNQTNASEHLSDREKHLIGLAVTLTRGCIYCSGGRMGKAIAAGISQDTVQATVDLTAAVNAGVVVRTALQGIEGNEADGSCDDGTCSAGS